MDNKSTTVSRNGMRMTTALLVKGDDIIAKGACGFDMSGIAGYDDAPGTLY